MAAKRPKVTELIDLDELLSALPGDSPCGEDLEYDPDFSELERLAEGTPEQQIGDTIVPAEDADWKAVAKQAKALAARTRDLRVAEKLTRAQLHTEGWAGFANGLGLIHGLLTQHWDCVHPELDAEDDNDPTFRINSIVALADVSVTVNPLRKAPLVESRAVGRFGLRDILIARGELPAGGETPPSSAAIDAAFQDAGAEAVAETLAQVNAAAKALSGIETTLMEQVGSGSAPDLTPLAETIRQAQKVMSEQAPGEPSSTADPAVDNADTLNGAPAAGVRAVAAPGTIGSREDVVRAIERITEYYRQNEPTSPIPLMLYRVKRLVHMDFLEIMTDMAPDGVHQIQSIVGPQEGDENEGDGY